MRSRRAAVVRSLSLAASIASMAAVAVASAAPRPARADELYTFVDSEGVLHVTNAPTDPRFRRVRQPPRREPLDGLHRIVIRGRSSPRMVRTASLAERSARFEAHIEAAAAKYGLSTPLLKAVMAVESNFDPAAVSDRGATGLMQLMPATARDLEVFNASDPAQNIEGGARYLRQLHDRFGNDLEKVLAAYNAGPEAVRRCGGAVPRIPETQAYVRKVLSLYQTYLRGS